MKLSSISSADKEMVSGGIVDAASLSEVLYKQRRSEKRVLACYGGRQEFGNVDPWKELYKYVIKPM